MRPSRPRSRCALLYRGRCCLCCRWLSRSAAGCARGRGLLARGGNRERCSGLLARLITLGGPAGQTFADHDVVCGRVDPSFGRSGQTRALGQTLFTAELAIVGVPLRSLNAGIISAIDCTPGLPTRFSRPVCLCQGFVGYDLFTRLPHREARLPSAREARQDAGRRTDTG